jgi:hypothetical protein
MNNQNLNDFEQIKKEIKITKNLVEYAYFNNIRTQIKPKKITNWCRARISPIYSTTFYYKDLNALEAWFCGFFKRKNDIDIFDEKSKVVINKENKNLDFLLKMGAWNKNTLRKNPILIFGYDQQYIDVLNKHNIEWWKPGYDDTEYPVSSAIRFYSDKIFSFIDELNKLNVPLNEAMPDAFNTIINSFEKRDLQSKFLFDIKKKNFKKLSDRLIDIKLLETNPPSFWLIIDKYQSLITDKYKMFKDKEAQEITENFIEYLEYIFKINNVVTNNNDINEINENLNKRFCNIIKNYIDKYDFKNFYNYTGNDKNNKLEASDWVAMDSELVNHQNKNKKEIFIDYTTFVTVNKKEIKNDILTDKEIIRSIFNNKFEFDKKRELNIFEFMIDNTLFLDKTMEYINHELNKGNTLPLFEISFLCSLGKRENNQKLTEFNKYLYENVKKAKNINIDFKIDEYSIFLVKKTQEGLYQKKLFIELFKKTKNINFICDFWKYFLYFKKNIKQQKTLINKLIEITEKKLKETKNIKLKVKTLVNIVDNVYYVDENIKLNKINDLLNNINFDNDVFNKEYLELFYSKLLNSFDFSTKYIFQNKNSANKQFHEILNVLVEKLPDFNRLTKDIDINILNEFKENVTRLINSEHNMDENKKIIDFLFKKGLINNQDLNQNILCELEKSIINNSINSTILTTKKIKI